MKDDEVILRDTLAVHRTALANERTLLSYIRTALTLFVAGITFIKFFENPLIISVGWLLLPVSVVVMVKGVISFRNMDRRINEEERGARDAG